MGAGDRFALPRPKSQAVEQGSAFGFVKNDSAYPGIAALSE
jgi:hypothetical protein